MATLYFTSREIAAKIVYFGPPGAGCNTNVKNLHALVDSKERSRLHQFGPSNAAEHSMYFDYVPSDRGGVPGFSLRFRIYSLPGGVRNEIHRHEVFDRPDAIVLVIDARASKARGNTLALDEAIAVLRQQHLALDRLPIVVQVNHTDAEDARDPDEVLALLQEFPVISAVARSRVGVLETHVQLAALVAERLRSNLTGDLKACQLSPATRDTVEHGEEVVTRHLAALAAAERTPRPSLELALSDIQLALTKRYLQLTPGPRHEVPFQPREYIGSKPVQILESRLEGERICLDVVMEHLAGTGPKRLNLVLVNRPPAPEPRLSPSAPPPPLITSALPDRIELPTPEPWDFPPVWYGAAGLFGGMLCGLMLGFIVWA